MQVATLAPVTTMGPLQMPRVAAHSPFTTMEPIQALQVPVVSSMQPMQQPQPMPLQQLQPRYVPEGRILRPSVNMQRIEPLAQAQPSCPIVHQASLAVQSSTSFVSPAQTARSVVHQAGSAVQSSTSLVSQAAEVSSLPQAEPVQHLQPLPECRIQWPSVSMHCIEPWAQADPSCPSVCQASPAGQSSTSFISLAQTARPVVHQTASALQSSSSSVSQAAEVSSLPQAEPVTAQLPHVRPPTPQFVQPQAAMPLATPQITPMPALRAPRTVLLEPQAPPQQPEREYDLLTLTPQGYEVRHLD